MDRFEDRSGFASLALVVLLGFFVGGLSFVSGAIEKANLIKGESVVSPTISPVDLPIVTPTPTSIPIAKDSVKNTQSAVGGSLYDCVGPDGKIFKTSESECKKLNDAWGKPVDYMVNCNKGSRCGGGTTYIKKSECDNATCCGFLDGSWVFYLSKSKCKQDQNSGKATTYIAPIYTPIPTMPLINCVVTYPCTGSSYTYQLDQEICNSSKQRAIDVCTASTATTITNTTNDVKKVDTSACYSQYNYDTQRANMYGGNVGFAITEMAKNNLERCLVSGTITAVGAVEQDTRPRDRNGKLCSEYGPEVKSYSQSMGCP